MCIRDSIVTDQFRYSMLFREPEQDIMPLCQQQGLSTLTYMSLEQGLLTGKVSLESVFEEGDFRTNAAWNPWYSAQNRGRVLDLLEGWNPLCESLNCNLPQLVLAWTLAQNGVTHVLAGARRPQQIEQTAAAADLLLDAETLQRMDRDLAALGTPQ